MRYSTARWGLLKLARIARWTCSRGKPMATISLTLVSRAEPAMNDVDESPDGTLAGAGVSASVAAGAAAAGAGPGALGATGVALG